jgi:hypothetical protein
VLSDSGGDGRSWLDALLPQLLGSLSARSFFPYKCLAGNNYRGWQSSGREGVGGVGSVPGEIRLPCLRLQYSAEAIAPSITRQCDRNGSMLKKAWVGDPKGAAKASLAFLSRSVWGGCEMEVVLLVGRQGRRGGGFCGSLSGVPAVQVA